MAVNPALLLLTDSRLPAGGHAHSGGTEQAIATGTVHDLASLAAFLRGRLHTSGHVAAALAAAACALGEESSRTGACAQPWPEALGASRAEALGTSPTRSEALGALWILLDAEADARTASPAQRAASRTQGRLLLRVARRLWPSPTLDDLTAGPDLRCPGALDDLALAVPNPHHPIALGAAAHAAGASPEDAALAAAYHAITGPATAAVRLLGLDPVAVHGLLADLTPDLATTASDATPYSRPWAELPARSAPALDLLAERHAGAKVRLFVS
ncbi:urease accessory protein UreF [Nonomuraea aurantiaca]|uniref:urease accessory protein UreF n=1 Tax=Nonomuraea aurantiaca TaxID=2878562 RepID=UPI001CD9CA32|nr:urease accessory UreF family protein [Nonomuraea aurantiaca]MCA2221644.1 urease accessory protein UreF [Nonomuraea aurantiaca]